MPGENKIIEISNFYNRTIAHEVINTSRKDYEILKASGTIKT